MQSNDYEYLSRPTAIKADGEGAAQRQNNRVEGKHALL